MPFRTLKGTLNFDYRWDALLSGEILLDMRQLFVQCKQMMNISDEELEAYRKEREQMDKGLSDDEETMNSIWNEVNRLQEEIDVARGMTDYDPAAEESVSDVVRRADKLMYENKWQNRQGREEEEDK